MKNIFIGLFSILPFLCSAQHGLITTVAGGDSWGTFAGDGGLATASAVGFSDPRGVTIDTAGNIYIYDHGNHRIRRVDAATGILTTIAGNGSTTYSGDGGPATAAGISPLSLSSPNVVNDAAGNVYFCDGSNRVRKIDVSSGIISTVAGNGSSSYSGDGGQATAAGLTIGSAIYVDSAGNLFLGDNSRIRKVDASTGVINTIAGTGTYGYSGDGGAATAATLCSVGTIVGDASNNLFFTDYSCNRVRKIDASGIITTIAGNGAAGISGNGGPATAARLDQPYWIGIDQTGGVYFSVNDGVIREVSTRTGLINKVAGCTRWCGEDLRHADSCQIAPFGMCVSSYGNIFFTPPGIHTVARIDSPVSQINTLSGTDSLATRACTLPATLHFGVHGTVIGIPAATDSVEVVFASGEFSATPERIFKLPYRYVTTYQFGDTFSSIGGYTYKVPGIYRPHIYLRTVGGFSDVVVLPTDTVGSACASGITGVSIDSAKNELMSDLCRLPRVIRHHVWGRVTGTPMASDSIYIVLNNGDHGLPFEMHVVACSLSGSTYYFSDTITHAYASGSAGQSIRAVASAGRSYADVSAHEFVTSCNSGTVEMSFSDTVSASTYCSLPLANSFSLLGGVYDSAILDTPYRLTVNFGDGTIYTPSTTFLRSENAMNFYVDNLVHSYTMSGHYTPTATLTAGRYSTTMAVTPFYAGTSCSPVSGVFYIDSNADCTNQLSESKLGYWPFAIVNNTLRDTTYVWCDDTGHYSANVIDGYPYTIYADPSIAFAGGSGSRALSTSCPSSGTYTFTPSGSSVNVDFGFSCATPPAIDMYPAAWSGNYFPGDTNNIIISASNPYGYLCDTLSATVTLVLDTILDYIGMRSGPSPASIVGNTLTWHFATTHSLFEFDGIVKARCHTTATTSDTVRNLISVSPCRITDPDTANNRNFWSEIIRNSYDPNDKLVSPKGFGPAGYIRNGTRLSYVIRFQNTGTAPARNITIVDTLPPTLDVSTLQILGYSFPFQIYHFPGNIVKFRFNDIYLPDSMSDPSGSNGYVAFNIMPSDTFANGTVISNDASIYFDYNPPILTPPAINTIEDSLLGITGPSAVCVGSSIVLGAYGFSGTWSNTTGNASISGGRVTGVSPGVDTIKFVSVGGQLKYKVIAVLSVPAVATIAGADSVCTTLQTTLTSSSSGGSWSSANVAVATVSSTGVVTGVTTGTTLISYTLSNACGSTSASKNMRVLNTIACIPSMIETNSAPLSTLRIYPNPNNGTFAVELPAGSGETALTVTDLHGRTVEEQHYPSHFSRIQISLKEKGIFFLKVTKGGTSYRAKVVEF